MLSICIVIASIAAAAYLIFKKYYAPGALLLVGLITLGVVACGFSPDPLITGKKATHLAGLDVIQIVYQPASDKNSRFRYEHHGNRRLHLLYGPDRCFRRPGEIKR